MASTPTNPVPPINFHALIAHTASKDGARARFQQLIAQLVYLRSPSVRQIEPNPGDWGIDCFVGELDDSTFVWQAKFFIDEVGSTQQQEIRESFETVIAKAQSESFRLAAWTLCIPVSLDAPSTAWWDKWKRKRQAESGVAIDLWDVTRLEATLLSPEAQHIREAYFGSPSTQPAPSAELPVSALPADLTYEEMLFVKQLRAAELPEIESAKRQFFNAEIMRLEVADKGVEAEVREVDGCLAEAHALWETRFNERCESSSPGEKLPGLYSGVMKAIEEVHSASKQRRTSVPMSLVHRLGTMHHVVEEGRAGWTRSFRSLANTHRGGASSE
jgi:hypothetical protein